MSGSAIKVAVVFLLALFVLAACGPSASPAVAPAPAPAASAPRVAGTATPVAAAPVTWEQTWETVVKAAEKEGTVTLFNTIGRAGASVLTTNFEAKYNVRLETVVGTASTLPPKIISERRAGIFSADVFIASVPAYMSALKPQATLDKLDPILVLPELTDPEQIKKVWWGGKLFWVDADHQILASQAIAQTPMAINTTLVKPEEVASFPDLLAPRWKGKIAMDDPTVPGFGQSWVTAAGSSLLGWDYFRQLAKQDLILVRDQRILQDWLAHGKYPIVLCPRLDVFAEFVQAGAPVALYTPQGGSAVTTGNSNTSMLNRAPHPNAAKLFINWLFTKEAQIPFSVVQTYPSLRLDVPTTHIEPGKLAYRDANAKYIVSDTEEFQLKVRPEGLKLVAEIFGPLVK